MSARAELSLIVPCYQEEGHLVTSTDRVLQALESLGMEYEVIFVDDCSTDRTRDRILEICARNSRCRYVFHERNLGRGGAFKTGFRSSTGRIVGFIDIDLEVAEHFIPPLVRLIDRDGVDVATGYRHYLLRQTGALTRHFLSVIYRAICNFLLGFGVKDSETGCKFFKRSTAGEVILASENNGWFWDTEVMSRAALAGLRIQEFPVLFLRDRGKKSTVRVFRDSVVYFRELMKFRPKVGLGLIDKSPIYWTGVGYDLAMRLLQGRHYRRELERVAALIPPGASVVDLCSGTSRIFTDHLRAKGVRYTGLDFNAHLLMAARKRGANVRFFDFLKDPIPPADYVIMCSSFYHFRTRETELLAKMKAAASKAVIVSEPVRNLSSIGFPPVAWLMNKLTNPGIGEFKYRYTTDSFHELAERNGAGDVLHGPGERNAVAVFQTGSRA